MVRGAALAAHPAAAHAVLDLLIADLNGDHPVEGNPRLGEGLGLADGAGHPVQNEAALAVRLPDALFHHADDHIIGDQLARVHIALGLQTHRSSLLNGGTEHVAGGDSGDSQLCAEDLRLGAFSRAGGAQQDQLHTHNASLPITPGSPCSAA